MVSSACPLRFPVRTKSPFESREPAFRSAAGNLRLGLSPGSLRDDGRQRLAQSSDVPPPSPKAARTAEPVQIARSPTSSPTLLRSPANADSAATSARAPRRPRPAADRLRARSPPRPQRIRRRPPSSADPCTSSPRPDLQRRRAGRGTWSARRCTPRSTSCWATEAAIGSYLPPLGAEDGSVPPPESGEHPPNRTTLTVTAMIPTRCDANSCRPFCRPGGSPVHRSPPAIGRNKPRNTF